MTSIRRLLLPVIIALVALTMPTIVSAQTVAVTGTITDTQTTPYSNGLLTVTFVNATGQLATFGGNPSFQKSYAIYLDSNGAFTISLPPNSTASPSIQPAGTQWNFSYQSQGGYGAANINVTITGAGSISGTLSNLARITWPYGNIPPPGAAGQGIVFVSPTTLGWSGAGLPTGCTSPGTGAITCTNNVLAANLPPALPTTPNGVSFIDTSTPAGGIGVAPAWSWPGVHLRSNAGATDAIVATDRGAGVLETNGGAVAISLPQAGSTNFGNDFDFFIKCATTTVCTITPTTSQIAGNNGTLGATLLMPASSTAYCYILSSDYQCGVVSTFTNFSTTNIVPKGNGTTLVSSSITDNGAVINASEDITSAGSLAAGSNIGETSIQGYIEGTTGSLVMNNTSRIRVSVNGNATGACDTSFSRVSAGIWGVGSATCLTGDVTGKIQPGAYLTGTNCSSSASPAVCGSAAAGSVAVPTGVTPTLVVNTTAVTANSQILFTPDESLGTKLGVTCNSTIAQVAIEPIVTARTAATSFTIQYNTTITVNPICLSYWIVN